MSMKLEGFGQVKKNLLELSQKEAQKVGRAALRAEGRPFLIAWREKVGVVSGRLRRALTLTVDRGRDRSWLFASIRIKPQRAYRPRKTDRRSRVKGVLGEAKYDYQIGTTPEVYGAIDEFGAPARNIAPKGWLRSVWDSLGGTGLIDRIGKRLGSGIEAAAAKMPKK